DSLMQDYSVNNQLRAGFSLADSGWMRVGARLTLGGCEVRDSVKIAVIPAPRITHLEYGTKVTSGADLQINLQTDLPGSVIHWAYVGNVAVLPPLDSGQSPALPQNGLWELNVPLFLADDTHLGEAMFFLHPENGDCQGRVDSVRINILPDGQDIFAPGVFTPNGDGKNDVWQIVWTDRVNPFDYMVSVFNRAGGRVFVRDGLAGTWTGDALPDGVYWYVIRRNDGQRDYAGGLTIRRR
ncbi:MAG TPA: gliding motility-associated C-terminal domain-containing protein, partial [Bacteroidetes bacterium]|nr:gliding motility-associated C-terminal domain-containing protein [Bacteroidota bacterium]